jgi:antibiotic biosynthesis monooxygenase (ABM) superfamily enzyme
LIKRTGGTFGDLSTLIPFVIAYEYRSILSICRGNVIMESPAVPGNVARSEVDGLSNAAVTKIVDRIPRSGMTDPLERAIKNLIAAALRFPGHLGVTVTRPALPIQPGFRLVYRFDTCEHLRAWEESEEHARLAAAADRFTQGEPQRTVLSGLETWFTLPGQPAAMPPPRSKITIMTWVGIFPLVYVFGTIVGMILPPDAPPILRIAIVTLLVVTAMTYVVGPLLTRLFHKWLQPG